MGKKKLSKKERNEAVTKGFIEDQGFVTKGYLEDVLNEKDYVTKSYMHEAFEVLDHKMQHYTTVVMEDNRAQTLKLIEAFDSRFIRLERAVFPEEFAA